MTKNNEEAQEAARRASLQAKQASRQVKAAAKNTGRAMRVAAEPVVDAVAEEVSDTADKLEGTAEDALHAARRVNVNVLGRISGDTGVGFLALSVAIYSGAIAYAKFRQAFSESKHITGG